MSQACPPWAQLRRPSVQRACFPRQEAWANQACRVQEMTGSRHLDKKAFWILTQGMALSVVLVGWASQAKAQLPGQGNSIGRGESSPLPVALPCRYTLSHHATALVPRQEKGGGYAYIQ